MQSASHPSEGTRCVSKLAPLARLVREISRVSEPTDLYEPALSALAAITHSDRSAILLLDSGGTARFVAGRGLSDEYQAAVEGHFPWEIDDPDPHPIWVSDVDRIADPELRASIAVVRTHLSSEGIRALAFVPLVHQERLVGTFMLYRSEPGAWPDRDVRLTQAIATHIAAAAQRHRAIAGLEESRRRLAAVLGEVADGITVQGPDGRLVYANDAAARMLEYDSPEALLAVSPDERPALLAGLADAVEDEPLGGDHAGEREPAG